MSQEPTGTRGADYSLAVLHKHRFFSHRDYGVGRNSLPPLRRVISSSLCIMVAIGLSSTAPLRAEVEPVPAAQWLAEKDVDGDPIFGDEEYVDETKWLKGVSTLRSHGFRYTLTLRNAKGKRIQPDEVAAQSGVTVTVQATLENPERSTCTNAVNSGVFFDEELLAVVPGDPSPELPPQVFKFRGKKKGKYILETRRASVCGDGVNADQLVYSNVIYSNLFEVGDATPSIPRNVNARLAGDSSIVKWKKPERSGDGKILGYVIRTSDDQVCKTKSRSCTIKSPNPGSTLTIEVTARNRNGLGLSARTKISRPALPTPTEPEKPDQEIS
jgi:hypothetical protein